MHLNHARPMMLRVRVSPWGRIAGATVLRPITQTTRKTNTHELFKQLYGTLIAYSNTKVSTNHPFSLLHQHPSTLPPHCRRPGHRHPRAPAAAATDIRASPRSRRTAPRGGACTLGSPLAPRAGPHTPPPPHRARDSRAAGSLVCSSPRDQRPPGTPTPALGPAPRGPCADSGRR